MLPFMKLIFATNNKNKIKEIQSALIGKMEILSLDDIGFQGEIPEDHDTLKENALQKSTYIESRFNVNCFADDTGLEIDTLDGRPGVYSARYAGEQASAENNIDKVLMEMKGESNRQALFRTVISLKIKQKNYYFVGVVHGQILESRTGQDGFGYDPIFQPDGYKQSFAEMSIEQKNKISHRGIAVKKLLQFLDGSVI